MTGGFNTMLRGIRIHVVKTINNYYKSNNAECTIGQFKKFLKDIGVKEFHGDFYGKTGCVIYFQPSEDDDGSDDGIVEYAYLCDGVCSWQSWVFQNLEKKRLKTISDITDGSELTNKNRDLLAKKWIKKLVLCNKYSVKIIPNEWNFCYK